MLINRICSWCDETGLGEKGFCHMCSGQGHHEVLEKAEEMMDSRKTVDLKKFILSISKFTTSEQLSAIMSDYLIETQLD